MEMITEYVMSRSAILNGHIYGKRVSRGYPCIVLSIIEGQRMVDTTWTCDPLLVSILYAMNTFSA